MNERYLKSSQVIWETAGRPGYLGKKRDEMYKYWDSKDGYGKGNWRIVNEIAGEIFTYEDLIWKIYVPGYVQHFLKNPNEALFVTDNFAYGYDKDMCTKQQAFDIHALHNKAGIVNQFHHTAFNIALEYYLGLKFKGTGPIQVREGNPGTPDSDQPAGFKWSPGRIKTIRPDLIPNYVLEGWWQPDSIEATYQLSKVLQRKVS